MPGMWRLFAVCLVGSTASAQGVDQLHGAREARPAVVNPVARWAGQEWVSLDGEWEIAMDPGLAGIADGWADPANALPEATTATVPGCWAADGLGGEGPSLLTTPEQLPTRLRGSYVGPAWYRKSVRVPAGWRGKRVWLKIGGVNSQGWFFANGEFLGHIHSYCGACKFEITDLVEPGKPLMIAALVRNDVPSRKGLSNWLHRFGGLYRSVELEATPAVYIDDVYAVPEFDRRSVSLRVSVDGTTDGAVLRANIRTTDGERAGEALVDAEAEHELTVRLRPFRPWSPTTPSLYIADVTLEQDGRVIHGWSERFGVRKWEVRGTDLTLNNERFLVRGFGDDYIYPVTLSSSASHEAHRKHLSVAREFGFNYVRHHTHCENPEFFEAADELGIMVQPELPYYGPHASGGPDVSMPEADLRELYEHYRRYTSFSTYCTGNEGHIGSPLDAELYQLAKALDPTRLMLHQDGGHSSPENSDYAVPFGDLRLHHRGQVDTSRPAVLHEYQNLATPIDPYLAKRYSGAVVAPRPMESYLADLEQSGLSREWGDACLQAGKELQKQWQKWGIEAARRDAPLDGYIYWTLVDVGKPSAQGLFDPFWQPKASTPEFFIRHNGETAVLAELGDDPPILGEGGTLNVTWIVSHFGAEPIDARLRWKLVANGKPLAKGESGPLHVAPGSVVDAGSDAIVMPRLKSAVKAQLTAQLAGTGIRNSWDVWLFPEVAESENGALFVRKMTVEALDRLAEGGTVVVTDLSGSGPGYTPGWWGMGAQAGTAIDAGHPLFERFPADTYMTEVFHRLLGQSERLADTSYRGATPLMVTQGAAGYLAHLLEARAGNGKLLACGLDLTGGTVESRYLREEICRYVDSPDFRPAGQIDLAATRAELAAREAFRAEANGWSETLQAPERDLYNSPFGQFGIVLCRATDGMQETAWRTAPVPADVDQDGEFTFMWLGLTGWRDQPEGTFTLWLGDRELVELGWTGEDREWSSEDGLVRLAFEVQEIIVSGQDSVGPMRLTLPAAWLTPGEPATLRVTGSDSNTRRWFGLYEFPPPE